MYHKGPWMISALAALALGSAAGGAELSARPMAPEVELLPRRTRAPRHANTKRPSRPAKRPNLNHVSRRARRKHRRAKR